MPYEFYFLNKSRGNSATGMIYYSFPWFSVKNILCIFAQVARFIEENNIACVNDKVINENRVKDIWAVWLLILWNESSVTSPFNIEIIPTFTSFAFEIFLSSCIRLANTHSVYISLVKQRLRYYRNFKIIEFTFRSV